MFPVGSTNALAPPVELLRTGWGMSSTVLSTVTGPLILAVSVEPLMKKESCDVGTEDKFMLQLRDGSSDIADAPDIVLEGFESAVDVEVTGDPLAAWIPSELSIERNHRDFMLVTTQGVESGRITDVGHFVR